MSTAPTTRFAQDTPDSQQAWLWVASLLALIYSILVLGVRVVFKWKVFSTCDVLVLMAYALSIVGHVCVYVALHYGMGIAADLVPEEYLVKIGYLDFISKLLMFPTLGLSKASVLVFARRLFRPEARGARSALRWAIIFVSVWSIGSLALLGPGCKPRLILVAHPVEICPHQIARMDAAAAIEAFTEILVVVLPIYLTLTRDLKREVKMMVCIGFGIRITILPLGIMYFYSYTWMTTSGRDGLSIVPNMILQEMLICWSLVLATTPTLRTFAGRFKTGGIRDILAPERLRKQSEVGMGTRAAAVIALKSIATQIRGINAHSIFDFNKHYHHEAPQLTRHDIANRHWANIFVPPGEENRTDSHETVGAAANPYSEWEMQLRDFDGWEKRRADQIINMPHRASLASIHFVTTVDDFAGRNEEVLDV
ncbi:hypothetical protein K461DRAFT_265204 [Myriangium duriaei CBS 260.36]|uniref:Rhodopsin domain-containing protein n=1 Tax=Myriangium duriaei CBS 260.36 TaxID=1168546 RepID=A0A9P4MJU4_9PEZI|nr:hypothetical protein K461DRAFT_265204 [Myriangium duriaei CBS 260.36]